MTLPTPNVPLLRKTLEKIDSLPESENCAEEDLALESWNQGRWFRWIYKNNHACGTAACFAGWSALLNGADVVENGELVRVTEEEYEEHPALRDVIIANKKVHISDYARIVLGLTTIESNTLFDPLNSREALHSYVNQIIELAELNTE